MSKERKRTMINCEGLKPFLAKEYRNLPESRYISVLLLRTTQSEAIFRTEGSGEGCSREIVADSDGEAVCRAIISKRKQVAVERREGRQILRKYSLLFSQNEKVTDETVCSMNRNNPCAKCIDCYLYGYAVGGGGAQRSRVISDDAYSLLPFDAVSDKKTFNALYETGTMRDPVSGKPSSSINEDEYIVAGTHFLDIEVLKDVTEGEFVYVLGNILRAKRYGAITSRIGNYQQDRQHEQYGFRHCRFGYGTVQHFGMGEPHSFGIEKRDRGTSAAHRQSRLPCEKCYRLFA